MTSCQEYANRLREDSRRILAPQVNDLEQELNNIRNDLSLSLAQLNEKLEAIRNFALPDAESVVDEALKEAARERETHLASLADFAYEVRRKETQEEILNLLLDEAVKHSPRVILYIVRGDKVVGWSSRGFSQEMTEEIGSTTFEQSASPQCEKALKSETRIPAVDIAGDDALKSLAEAWPGPWHVFPLKAIGRPVALLMASVVEGQSYRLESLSILVTSTGTCIENIALRILHELRPQQQRAPKEEEVPAAFQISQETEVAPLETVADVESVPAEKRKPLPTLEREVAPLVEQIVAIESGAAPEITAPEPAPIPEHEPLSAVREEQPAVAHDKMAAAVETGPAAMATEEQEAEAQQEQPAAVMEEQAPPEEPGRTVAAQVEPLAEAFQEQPIIVEQERVFAPAEEVFEPKKPEIAQGEQPTMASQSFSRALVHEETIAAAVVEDQTEEISQAAEPVPIPLGPPPAPRMQARVEPPPKIPLPIDAQRLTEEMELHTAAKRFARLLVSEIKLYNEQRVLDGRENRDIYVRLKRDIDRSREMYDKRIPASVTRKNDYFHDEIVRILGENDPSTLGSDYPGPRVES